MTWNLTHVTEEQADRIVECAQENEIDIIALAGVSSPKAVLIKSGGEIILANAPEVTETLQKAISG